MPVESAPVSDVNEQARAPQARATGFTPVKTGRVKYLLWKWRRTLDSFGAKAGPAARPVALSPAKSFFLPLLPPLLPHETHHHRRRPAHAGLGASGVGRLRQALSARAESAAQSHQGQAARLKHWQTQGMDASVALLIGGPPEPGCRQTRAERGPFRSHRRPVLRQSASVKRAALKRSWRLANPRQSQEGAYDPSAALQIPADLHRSFFMARSPSGTCAKRHFTPFKSAPDFDATSLARPA